MLSGSALESGGEVQWTRPGLCFTVATMLVDFFRQSVWCRGGPYVFRERKNGTGEGARRVLVCHALRVVEM